MHGVHSFAEALKSVGPARPALYSFLGGETDVGRFPLKPLCQKFDNDIFE